MATKPKKISTRETAVRNFVTQIIKKFQRYYPDANCALDHKSPFELLIATILSAQCTDERVNMVTPNLFKTYPNPKKMGDAPLEKIEEIIRSTGFYKNKAKNIKSCCQKLMEEHGGEVPRSIEDLTGLPGVGRKTANVVLGNAFNISSGVVVDTHVTRLSNRFGLVKGHDAVKIESVLNQIVPQEHWIMFSHWLIHHGRQVCKARKPDCAHCFLQDLCPKKGV